MERRGWVSREGTDWLPVALTVVTFLGIAGYYRATGFSVVISDVGEYLNWSRAWWVARSTAHFPGYPFLLWLIRTLSFGLLDGLLLMQVTTLAALVVGTLAVGRILDGLLPAGRRFGALLYGLFPLVGVSYAVYPVADSVAAALLAVALLCLLRARWLTYTGIVAAALFFHQGLWPFLGLMGLVAVWKRGYPLAQFLLSGLPLVAYIGKVAMDRGSLLWWLDHHIQVHLRARVPVLDGVLGTLTDPGLHNLFKGLFLLTLFFGCVWVAAHHLRRRDWLMAALALGALFWLVVLNRAAIWAAVRHARPLAVPAAVALYASPRRAAFLNRTWVILLVAAGLIATQLVFALYIRNFFQGAVASAAGLLD